MLKFHQIVVRKFLLIFITLFIVLGGIIYYWTKEFYIEQTRDSLLQNIETISFTLQDLSQLDSIAQKIKSTLQLRLTVIKQNGEVISESHKDKNTMDNHKYRDEIMQANKEDYGYIIRHSDTINKDLLYIAKKYTFKDEVIYIRLSKELRSIKQEIFSLGIKIVFVLIIFLAFFISVTYRLSAKIEYEMNKISTFLSSLAKKEKPNYISSDLSLEFYNITKLLTKVTQILAKKDKRKSKFTAKLQESNQQKDDIISAISHEFKNPIAVINGYSQTLLGDENLQPSIRQKFLTKIYKNGTKLSELIDTLRLSTKLDNGRQSIMLTHVNIYELVLDVVETIGMNYSRRNIIIEGDKNIFMKVDEALFTILVSNLVENACKYSEDEVFIKFDEKSLSVKDTGIGISKNNLDNITNKFYRVNENSWNNSLGLGLFIVNNIITLHNFKLHVESQENEGSTFSITM